jgi:hypothetical protein
VLRFETLEGLMSLFKYWGKIANSLILQGGKRYISHYFIINATKAMECSLRGITTGKPLMNRPRPTTQTNGTIIMGLRYLGEKCKVGAVRPKKMSQ